MDLFYSVQLELVSAESCLLKFVQEFLESFKSLKKNQPDKDLCKCHLQEVLEDEILEELSQGEKEGRKVWFCCVNVIFFGCKPRRGSRVSSYHLSSLDVNLNLFVAKPQMNIFFL